MSDNKKKINPLKFRIYKFINLNPNGKKSDAYKLDVSNPFERVNPIGELEESVSKKKKLFNGKKETKNKVSAKELNPKKRKLSSDKKEVQNKVSAKELNIKKKKLPKVKKSESSNKDRTNEQISKVEKKSNGKLNKVLDFILFGKANNFYNKRFVPKVLSLKDLLFVVLFIAIGYFFKLKYGVFGTVFFSLTIALFCIALKIGFLSLRVFFSKFLSLDVLAIFLGYMTVVLVTAFLSLYVPLKIINGPFHVDKFLVKNIGVDGDRIEYVETSQGVIISNAIGSKFSSDYLKNIPIGGEVSLKYFRFLGNFYFIDVLR